MEMSLCQNRVRATGDTLTLTTTSTALANGIDTNTITAKLTNSGSLVPSANILFSVTGTALFSNGFNVISAQTNVFGEAVAYITNTVAEKVTITVLYENTLSATGVSEFKSESTGPDIVLEGTILADNAPTDGSNKNSIRYLLKDRLTQQPVPSEYLFFATTGSAHLDVEYGQVNSAGQFVLSLANSVAENVLITARLASNSDITEVTQLSFSQTSVEPVLQLTSEVLNNNAEANGSDTNVIRFLLKDLTTGLGVANQILQLSHTGSAQVQSSVTTSSSGYATVTVSNSIAESVIITARLSSDLSLYSNATITFTAQHIQYQLTSTIDHNNAVANGVDANILTYRLERKDTGQGVANQSIVISRTGSAQGPNNVITDAAGYAQVKSSNTVAEPTVVTGRLYVDSTVYNTATLNFTSPAAQYYLSSQVISNNALADGESENRVRFILTNAVTGNPVANEWLQLYHTGSAIMAIQGRTNSYGYLDIDITNYVAESVTVTALLDKDTTVQAVATVVFQEPMPTYIFDAVIIRNNARPDGYDYNIIRYSVRDSRTLMLVPYVEFEFVFLNTPYPIYYNTTGASGVVDINIQSLNGALSYTIKASLLRDRNISQTRTVNFSWFRAESDNCNNTYPVGHVNATGVGISLSNK